MPESEDELFKQRDRDLAKLYPTPEAWERSYPPLKPPDHPEERAQYDDLQEKYRRENIPEKHPREDIPDEKKGTMKLSDETKKQVELAAAGTKNVNEGKALKPQTVGTDDTRTPPLTPGYVPDYGQSVTKVEPPEK